MMLLGRKVHYSSLARWRVEDAGVGNFRAALRPDIGSVIVGQLCGTSAGCAAVHSHGENRYALIVAKADGNAHRVTPWLMPFG
jgi:hypothetical protein